jgi:hypothetical protein
MSTSEDHEGLANELERETDALKRESDQLGQEISDARSDWESKRNDPSVPGAPAPENSGQDDADEDRPGSAGEDVRSDDS